MSVARTPEGVNLITCKSRPRKRGAPRQTTEEGAFSRGGQQPPSSLCMQVLETVGKKLPTASTWEDSWPCWEGWSPTSRSEAGRHSPQPASLRSSRGRGGQLHQQPTPKSTSLKQPQRAGTGAFLPRRGRSQALSLRLDPVPEHKVCQQPQGKEENAQDQEVHVEFGLLHIQLTQNDLWVPEWALFI